MNVDLSHGFGAFGAFAVILGLATTIFWMVVGWRAMRAHERLADAAEDAAKNSYRPPLNPNSPR